MNTGYIINTTYKYTNMLDKHIDYLRQSYYKELEFVKFLQNAVENNQYNDEFWSRVLTHKINIGIKIPVSNTENVSILKLEMTKKLYVDITELILIRVDLLDMINSYMLTSRTKPTK